MYTGIFFTYLYNVLFLTAFLFCKPEAVPFLFRDVTAEHQRMFNMIKASNLNWIAVLPPHIAGMYHIKNIFEPIIYDIIIIVYTLFSDTPKSKYVVKHDESPGRSISKYDLAAFLVDCLRQSEHCQKVCGIATVP